MEAPAEKEEQRGREESSREEVDVCLLAVKGKMLCLNKN